MHKFNFVNKEKHQNTQNRNYAKEIKEAKGLKRLFGLMFTTRNTHPLVFKFEKPVVYPIHSFFVFYKFLAIWEDEDGRFIENRYVYPFEFNIKPSKPFTKLYEVPL